MKGNPNRHQPNPAKRSKKSHQLSSNESPTMPMPMPDWSSLPLDLLETIARKLSPNFVDIIRFQSVCTSWRSTSLSLITSNTPPSNLPWLLLAFHKTNNTRRGFFSLVDNKPYWFDLSPSRQTCCCGSSKGWLLMVDPKLVPSLVNPINNLVIPLPDLFTIHSVRLHRRTRKLQANALVKAVSSSTPDMDDCLVVIICVSSEIVFCKPNDRYWTHLRQTINLGKHYRFDDLAYFQGKFYAVSNYGRVVVFQFGDSPSATEVRPACLFRADKNYLVENSGKLLVVSRYRGWSERLDKVWRTVWFQVFEWNPANGSWVGVKCLGDRSLFLGPNHSFSLVASDFSRIKGNCIYFADNISKDFTQFHHVEFHDVGIFHLEDSSIEPLPGYKRDKKLVRQPAMWVTPSPPWR